MKHIKLFVLLLISSALTQAQIQIVDSGASGEQVDLNGTYNQGFDIPVAPNPAPYTPWVDNATLAGWYSTSIGIKDYGASILSLGADGGAGDRALGAAGALGGKAYFALRLQNLSSSSVSGVSVKFDGEQWYRRAQSNGPQTPSNLTFSYQIFAVPQNHLYSDDDNTAWTYVPALTFVSPNATLNTNQIFLDGNAPENSIRGIEAFFTGLDVAPGQELWLRWGSQDVQAGIVAQGLGIDNLRVSFTTTVPEPTSYSVVAGAGALLATLLCRRRARGVVD
jgi:hypothetical protein